MQILRTSSYSEACTNEMSRLDPKIFDINFSVFFYTNDLFKSLDNQNVNEFIKNVF